MNTTLVKQLKTQAPTPTTTTTTTMSTTLKHIKTQNSGDDDDRDSTDSVLLPGLPNHLSHLCLSSLHPSLLYPVCRSWRRLIFSPSFPPFLSLYAILSPATQQTSNPIQFFSLDPISSHWRPLPPPPPPDLRLLRRHPSFISRTLPVQSLTVSGRLLLVAATATHRLLPALRRPLLFDPLSREWSFGPPLSAPRRWCAAGSAGGAVYVASGIGSRYDADVARSVEKWDLKRDVNEWRWERMGDLQDGRFSREAVEIVGFRRRLWMVNVRGNASKQGAVCDVERGEWEEMPERVAAGWSGPAAAAAEEDVMYVVDERKGCLRRYDCRAERWEVVVEESEVLRGAEQMAAGGGRVCVVCGGGRRIAVVDVVARPARVWAVSPPPGMEVVAVHILPRMSWTE